MKKFVAFVLCVFGCSAQPFDHLETNEDGSVLYFSSYYRLKGTNQVPFSKIFRWTAASGVQLVEQVDHGPGSFSLNRWNSQRFFRLFASSVSADGRTFSRTGKSDCTTSSACVTSFERYETKLRLANGGERVVPGFVSLSPSGRYGLVVSSKPFTFGLWLDVLTGETKDVQPHIAANRLPVRRRIADDGSILLQSRDNQPALWKNGQLVKLTTVARNVTGGMLNDSASRALLLDGFPERRLLLHDVQVRRDLVLDFPVSKFTISRDASVIAYSRDGAVWTIGADGRGRLMVFERPEAVTDLILSGDGRVLYVNSGGNRVFRIDLNTRSAVELFAAAADRSAVLLANCPGGVITPGAVCSITEKTLPLAAEIKIGDREVVPLQSAPGELSFQVPWDFPIEESPLESTARSKPIWIEIDQEDSFESPFDAFAVTGEPRPAQRLAPSFYSLNSRILAAHENFSGLINDSSPVQPNEIVHVYGSGFGPVQPAVESNQPATTASAMTESLRCELGVADDYQPVEVLYAGLAPGMIGIYQLNLKMPPRMPANPAYLGCSVGSQTPPAVASGLLPVQAGAAPLP